MPAAIALPGLAEINRKLQLEVEHRVQAQEALESSNKELREFTASVLDREDRIIELKNEVNVLLGELGQNARYANKA